MARGLQRTAFNGTALIRLLAQLSDVDIPEAGLCFTERLSQWLSWTGAISLSAALNGTATPPPSGARACASAEEGELNRVRTSLVKAIAEDSLFTAAGGRGYSQTLKDEPMDARAAFSPYRRFYLAKQQAMEASIGPLRARLRAVLAGRSPAMARLAAIDAVMEQALAAQERSLLGTVPRLLEKHFDRLRRDDEDSLLSIKEAPFGRDGSVQPRTWLVLFCKDMQSVLLAEVGLRLQPVEALLEALRTRQPGRNE